MYGGIFLSSPVRSSCWLVDYLCRITCIDNLALYVEYTMYIAVKSRLKSYIVSLSLIFGYLIVNQLISRSPMNASLWTVFNILFPWCSYCLSLETIRGPLNKTEFHLPKKAEIGTLVKEKVLNYILCFFILNSISLWKEKDLTFELP